MAPVTVPKMVAAPIPASTGRRQDAAATSETLRAKSGPATSREPRTRGRVGPGVKSSRAINRESGASGRVRPVARRRLRGESLG
jgi:hypothetical protein